MLILSLLQISHNGYGTVNTFCLHNSNMKIILIFIFCLSAHCLRAIKRDICYQKSGKDFLVSVFCINISVQVFLANPRKSSCLDPLTRSQVEHVNLNCTLTMSTATAILMSLSVFLPSPVTAWTSGTSRGEGVVGTDCP